MERNLRAVRMFLNGLHSGREEIENYRSGRPKDGRRDKNVRKMMDALKIDKCLSFDQIDTGHDRHIKGLLPMVFYRKMYTPRKFVSALFLTDSLMISK